MIRLALAYAGEPFEEVSQCNPSAFDDDGFDEMKGNRELFPFGQARVRRANFSTPRARPPQTFVNFECTIL